MEDLLNSITETAAFLEARITKKYTYGIILGSGLGNLSSQIKIDLQIPYADIPGFIAATAPGHKGALIFGELGGKNVVAMSGRFHYYEGYDMRQITFPVRVMKRLGVETLIISNASGGMNPDYEVGDLMIINDHIDMFPENPLRGKNYAELGSRFPNMHEAYDKTLVQLGMQIAKSIGVTCHQGVYLGLTGPTFETPAEYKAFRIMGADVVGMSTVPEVIVARHGSMKVFAVSVVSDMGYPPEKADKVTLEMVLEKAAAAEPGLTQLVIELLKEL